MSSVCNIYTVSGADKNLSPHQNAPHKFSLASARYVELGSMESLAGRSEMYRMIDLIDFCYISTGNLLLGLRLWH